jgi:5-methylcytosine-specific restriction endonuclease McrA
MSLLNQNRVLVLNRAWQAIGIRTVKEGLLQMAADAATGLDTRTMQPIKWDDWIKLPVEDEDDFVTTPNLRIRIPRVIVAVNYAKVPKKRPRLNMGNLRKRYNNTCAITGRMLSIRESSKEHVVPVSRGGRTEWPNVVLAHKDINSKRGNKTYAEAGLSTPRVLPAPREIPISETIENIHNLPEWEMFIRQRA